MRRFLSKLTPRQMAFTNSNSFLGQQEKIKLVHLDLGNYHVIFRFRLPIAYHGRASSIVISGTDIIRPRYPDLSLSPTIAPRPIGTDEKSPGFEFVMMDTSAEVPFIRSINHVV
ncbi:uncharacterized protein LOC106345162 isoform X2 [Brassica napus]|nr:uncharacterized protein LOC106345162 isoform X2 [Brassica napus]